MDSMVEYFKKMLSEGQTPSDPFADAIKDYIPRSIEEWNQKSANALRRVAARRSARRTVR
jgi:hypothetical protein